MAVKTGIGIDTGGTYTDAVVYDFENHKVLGAAKALTTREDLSAGILEALDKLPLPLLREAEILSLSTTLTTNACVEDRVGQSRLIFFGGDRRVIDEYGAQYGLPPAGDMLIQESYTAFSGKIEREPDWDLFRDRIRQGFDDLDGVGILEMNAMKNGAVVEKKAKAIFQEQHNVPVVCGHELFSELNCLQRGSSTLLNAGLFSVIQSFLRGIKTAMQERGIHAAVVVVRSDGSLMSETFAAERPVETLLCGPAASVLGGHALSNEMNSVIIDMGGTTTDIALIRDGSPVTVTDGVQIGRWKTFVDGLYVKTFGLGGDSAVHYRDKRLILEEYRVTPLCVAAKRYPSILRNLKTLLKSTAKHTRFLHEHYLLVRDIDGSARYTDEEKAFCRALKNGPLILKEAAAAIDRDVYTLDVSRLIRDGVVQRCGLTPTDIMHIRGDFTEYSAEAAALAAEFVARNLEISTDELCERVYDEVKHKLYRNVVKALLENQYPCYGKNGVGEETERFIDESYSLAKSGGKADWIAANFSTDFSLLGIGAPIAVFLPDVAALLGARAVIPEYSGVANALGAVVGNVAATHTIEIRPCCEDGVLSGYIVFGNDEARTFQEPEDAEEYALREAEASALAKAKERGARGHVAVTSRLEKNEAPIAGGTIDLGSAAIARAVGTIGF